MRYLNSGLMRMGLFSWLKLPASSGIRDGSASPRILLIDDDAVFGQIMLGFAKRENLSLTYVNSTQKLHQFLPLNFNIALLDYDLGPITGVQLTHFIERFTSIPVILISHYREIGLYRASHSIKGFIHKSVGPAEILDTAVRTYRALGHA